MYKNYTIYISFFLLWTPFMNAQIEQISVGPGYAMQAYYDLATGEITQVSNDAWDIAFSNQGQLDGGIFINESPSAEGNQILLFLSDSSAWDAVSTDTSLYADSLAIYNAELDWTEGAFNSVKDPGSPFDYGWGAYNPMTHMLEGNRIFVIKQRDGLFLKFQVSTLSGGQYIFRYAALNGSNEVLDTVAKGNDYPALIHYSFATQDIVEMPTDYDLVFARYTTSLDAGGGLFLEYLVTGVLLGPGTEAITLDSVDVETVTYTAYQDSFSAVPTTIGHEWKSFALSTFSWEIDEDRLHFVKTSDGEIYKIVFYDFEGSMTGITTLEKTLVGSISSSAARFEDVGISAFPNPATDFLQIQGVEANTLLSIFDYQGRLLVERIIRSNDRIDVSTLNSGTYILSLKHDRKVVSQPLIINR